MHLIFFLSISQPSIFVGDGWYVAVIEAFTHLLYLLDSLPIILKAEGSFLLSIVSKAIILIFINKFLQFPGPGTGV